MPRFNLIFQPQNFYFHILNCGAFFSVNDFCLQGCTDSVTSKHKTELGAFYHVCHYIWEHFSLKHVWGLRQGVHGNTVLYLTLHLCLRWCTSAPSSHMLCSSVSWCGVWWWREPSTASLTCSPLKWEKSVVVFTLIKKEKVNVCFHVLFSTSTFFHIFSKCLHLVVNVCTYKMMASKIIFLLPKRCKGSLGLILPLLVCARYKL